MLASHRPLIACLAGVVAGCFSPVQDRSWVAPFDGQSAVRLDDPLVIQANRLDYPPGLALPQDLVVVVDLTSGEQVPGVVQRADAPGDGSLGLYFEGDRPEAQLHFAPDAPWQPDHRYAWRVEAPLANRRGATLALDAHLVGEAVFTTRNAPELLSASLDSSFSTGSGDWVCLAFSQSITLDEVLAATLAADGVALEVFDAEIIDFDQLNSRFWSPTGVACVSVDAPSAGAELTLTRGDLIERVTVTTSPTDVLEQRWRRNANGGGLSWF